MLRIVYPALEAHNSWILGDMRLTDFWSRMSEHFGEAYAESYARDFVIAELGGRTVCQALDEGEDAKDVWRAVCIAADVPAPLR